MSTSKTATTDQKEDSGLWIGVDFGTSNCAAAVWDSTRGRPKWMRLQDIAIPESSKAGRIVPSTVALVVVEDPASSLSSSLLWKEIRDLNPQLGKSQVSASVGHAALRIVEQEDSSTGQILSSIKRILSVCGTTPLDELDSVFRDSLPFELEETKDRIWVVKYSLTISNSDNSKGQSTTTTATTIYLRPIHVAAIILQAMRIKAQDYLKRNISKKQMDVPGGQGQGQHDYCIKHIVLGVPAYYGQKARQSVEQAARLGGFSGQISTLTESTAAAMAYGLFVTSAHTKKSILVLDMGGGTTDITIAEMKQPAGEEKEDENDDTNMKFQVVLTEGDPRLGGDDMDHALCDRVLQQYSEDSLSHQDRRRLTKACQSAKESLCGNVDQGDAPAEEATVVLPNQQGSTVTLKQSDLEEALKPILRRLQDLVQQALQRYTHKTPNDPIQEVILVGGATRVPAVRRTLQSLFPKLELCTSVNPMSAVAQGTAIQAAILSHQVPLHQIQSAMMLDTMPYAIGVLSAGGDFCEILPRDSPLPAQGYATFSLADIHQRGVTVQAVEQICTSHGNHDGDAPNTTTTMMYEPLGDFTFLLHRLQNVDMIMKGPRQVDIGMTLTTNGEFHVSIFDPRDPDHQRKKRFLGKEIGILDYVQVAATDERITSEEIKLIVMALFLFCFYIFMKVVLPKEDAISEEGARIL